MNPITRLRSTAQRAADAEMGAADAAIVARARDALQEQAEVIRGLGGRLDATFARAVRLLARTPGHVVVAGLGKSGHVGRKLAATLASTGTPSFFVHATEALHGDLGKITGSDSLVLLSYSGETNEVLELLVHARARNVPTVAIVGRMSSTLASGVDVALEASVPRETCPNNLAPTSSTLAALAVGDALAVCLMHERAFRAEDFARFHPAGELGKRLRMRAHQCMSATGLPVVGAESSMSACMVAATRGRLGVAVVVDAAGAPIGMLTEPELAPPDDAAACARWLNDTAAARMRRTFVSVEVSAPMAEVESSLAAEGDRIALVTDAHGKLAGVIDVRG